MGRTFGLIVLTLLACGEQAPTSAGNVETAQVRVTPSAASLEIGEATQLVAAPVDASGNLIANRAVSWTVVNPSVAGVDAAGTVTGISEGTTTVAAGTGGRAGTASISVLRAAVASISLTPSSLALTVGETASLTARLLDRRGRILTGRVVMWTSSNPGVASVGASGLVTANAAGSASITAASEGQSASAAVAVTSVVVPPPPPPVAGELFRDDFESTAALGSGQGPNDARFGDICCSGSPFTVVNPASLGFAAFSGSRVLRVGTPGGAMTHWIKSTLGSTTRQPRDRLYFSVRLYVPSSWTAVMRFMMIRGSRDPWGSFGITNTCPVNRTPQTEFVAASVTHSPVRMYTYWLGMDPQAGQPWTCTGTTGLFPNDSPPATYHLQNYQIPRNTWVQVELEMQMNTVGQANGWERIWVNGTLVMEHLGVTYRRDPATLFQAITIDSGNIASGLAFYLDDLIVRPQR